MDNTRTVSHRVSGSGDPTAYPTTLSAVDVAVTVEADTTARPLAVQTLDDRQVEPPETFTVTATVPEDALVEIAAEGRIKGDDTERARPAQFGGSLGGRGTDAGDGRGSHDRGPLCAAADNAAGNSGRAGGGGGAGAGCGSGLPTGGRRRCLRAGGRRGMEHVDPSPKRPNAPPRLR